MSNFYFFDLPVYRLSEDMYEQNQLHDLETQLTQLMDGLGAYEIPPATKCAIKQHQYDNFGSWQFNEIIGYIRLYFLGSQIRGEYFSAEKKRNPISRRKVFTYRTWKLAPEISIWSDKEFTNANIFEKIKEYIADCKKELAKNRVIDDRNLLTIGQHADWRKILGWD